MTITRFFSIHPDSLVGRRLAGPNANERTSYAPLYTLMWVFWVFVTPLIAPQQFPHWLWPTLASFAVFLILYFRAYFRVFKRALLWHALAIAGLGYALLMVNPGGQGYLIYACAFLAYCGRPLRAVGLMLLVLLPYAAISWWFGVPWVFLASMVMMGLAVGVSNIVMISHLKKNAELKLTHDEVRRLAATAERERIGRDLHDLLGHTLSLIALKSELAGKLLARDPVAARREIADVERTARDALVEVRSAVSGMRAAGLIGEFASAKLLLESAGVRFSYSSIECELQSAQESCLALALREAVTNIQRHAAATAAHAELVADENHAQLIVRDDGRGVVDAHGNGLKGMRERVEGLGGTLQIEAQRGQGTVLTLQLPKTIASNVVPLLPPAAQQAHA
ncbi:MAG: sensor histidine kinase [Lysobacteraceae bacterium]